MRKPIHRRTQKQLVSLRYVPSFSTFILNQHGTYTSAPVSPWKPFGTRDLRTPIWRCDVMLPCGHYLRYASWKWENEKEETIIHHHTTAYSTPKDWTLGEGEDEYVDDEEMHSIHYRWRYELASTGWNCNFRERSVQSRVACRRSRVCSRRAHMEPGMNAHFTCGMR